MCDIGSVIKRLNVPKDKAITAYRTFRKGEDWYSQTYSPSLISRFSIAAGPDSWAHVIHHFNKTNNRSNKLPSLKNSSGFWCYNNYIQALGLATLSSIVIAKVKIYGRVIKHENGYRASKLDIISVYSKVKGYKLPEEYKGVRIIVKD